MNKSTLLLVRETAKLLISRIDEALHASEQEEERRISLNESKSSTWLYTPLKENRIYLFPKLSGNIKRTSMELTRLLADLRQNR